MNKNIYLIRRQALGDVLWIEPIIRQLSNRHNKILVYTKYQDIFLNHPCKNVIFKNTKSLFEKLKWQFEKIFLNSNNSINLDMAYERNPKIHVLNAYQKKANLPITFEYPKLYLSDEEKLKKITLHNNYVVLHLESFSVRNYRKVFGINWNTIADYLKSKGYTIIQIGKFPENISGVTHIKTSVRDMINLISKSKFFIGLDSGPSHIAASLEIPSLVFFGAVNPEMRHFKELFKGYFLQQKCEYAGCYHESISIRGEKCKLVGDHGIPKCSLHSNEYVINHIDKLIKEYNIE